MSPVFGTKASAQRLFLSFRHPGPARFRPGWEEAHRAGNLNLRHWTRWISSTTSQTSSIS